MSLPALVPVTFELTALVAGFATLGALFVRVRLYPRVRPERAPRQPDPRVTDGRFVVLVLEEDASLARERFSCALDSARGRFRARPRGETKASKEPRVKPAGGRG